MSDQAGGFDHLTTEITQLRQSTNELGDCRVELGRYQFLEDKEKRKKRIRHLNVECHSQQKQDAGNHSGIALSNPHPATHMTGLDLAASSTSPICAEGYTAAMDDDPEPEVLEQRLPDGSDDDGVRAAVETDCESSSNSNSSDIQSFTLLKKLLAISNLLSKEEVKQIKFLAKSKISNDRLARISKAYEVFKELEKDGEFPISYITKLLKAVKRDDLVVKLKAVTLTEEEEGQAGTSRLPGEDGSFPYSSQSSDSDIQPDTHDRCQRLRKRTSLRSSRIHEQLQSSEEDLISSDETEDSQISSSISSPDSGSETGSAGAQLLTSSAGVTLPVPSGSTVIPSSDNMSAQTPTAGAESNSNSRDSGESANSQPPGYWERLGARPKQFQQSPSREPMPYVIPVDGIDPSFLAKHSQDDVGCGYSHYQSSNTEIPLLNDSPSNGGLCSDSESSVNKQLLTLQQSHTCFIQILQKIREIGQERRNQLLRGQRSIRERRNQHGREIQEALRTPQQEQEEVIARSQLYRLWFPCCMQYYPSSYCHSRDCDKACHVTHLTCSQYHDQHAEQQNDEGSEKTPSHNCVMCNKCFNPLEETHLCEPDECCQCSGFLDAFSGCQILPCRHKVHEDCAIAMIQNGIHTCPICQRPIFDSPG